MATVQLVHRLLAYTIMVCAALLWWRVYASRVSSTASIWSNALVVAVALQACAGIATLLSRVAVPLAAIHQAGALVVFTCALGLAHALGRPDGYTRKAAPTPKV
jgi:cytochrome c oxidase assembly protein subunit 15